MEAVIVIAGTYIAIPVLGLIWIANRLENQNCRRLLREAVVRNNLRR